MKKRRILFVKPPDRFLENEFVYPQLGPHYLQSYLLQNGFKSDILVLFERHKLGGDHSTDSPIEAEFDISNLSMLLLGSDGASVETSFDHAVFEAYDIVGFSVMTPQAPAAYKLNKLLKRYYPHLITIIGGSHARYYEDQVSLLPAHTSFDFIVPQDGWKPMLDIATGNVQRGDSPTVLSDKLQKLTDLPAPTRPLALMKKYDFEIAGVPAYHTVTALGCPFTCHFCESGIERVRTFSQSMISKDLQKISDAHDLLGHDKKAVMFFDDVGLMSPKQVARLSSLVKQYGFSTWRAFTHAYLVVKHKQSLLNSFIETGGKRIGIGLETGSQRSLDIINKRNGKKQWVEEHYESVSIANALGVAVDAFTMIYPWEDEKDLAETNKLVEFIAANPVNGLDEKQRPMHNHVDATIMSPYQGTKFYDMIKLGTLKYVEIDPTADPGNLYYKGVSGASGWPYKKTRLSREDYVAAQEYRNSFRPKYR